MKDTSKKAQKNCNLGASKEHIIYENSSKKFPEVLIRPLVNFNASEQCWGSGSVLDAFSGALWIRIRIQNTDPDPHM